MIKNISITHPYTQRVKIFQPQVRFMVNVGVKPKSRNVPVHALPIEPNSIMYYTGKSIILFTMFYCSLQWMHYRRMRIDVEKQKKQVSKNDINKDKKKGDT